MRVLSFDQPSTALFKVPATALLNCKTAASLYHSIRGRKLTGVQLVSLHLFLHKPLGDADSTDTAFGPYISTLPRDFSAHSLYWVVKRDLKREDPWEQHVLDTLPPEVRRKLVALRQRFWDDWRVVSRTMVRSADLYPSGRITLHRSKFLQPSPCLLERT